MPDYLRRLSVALQVEHTQLTSAINAINLGIQNVDGGAPDSVFTATQHLDGGTA